MGTVEAQDHRSLRGSPSRGRLRTTIAGRGRPKRAEGAVSLVTGLGEPSHNPAPVLTEFRVPMAASAQLLQIALQDVGEEVAGAELHRVPAQRLADLRHRDPQQRPGVTLAHPAA